MRNSQRNTKTFNITPYRNNYSNVSFSYLITHSSKIYPKIVSPGTYNTFCNTPFKFKLLNKLLRYTTFYARITIMKNEQPSCLT